MGYLLDYLAPRLPDGCRAFLTALLAAINDPDLASALDRFPIWRYTKAVPRDSRGRWPKCAAYRSAPLEVTHACRRRRHRATCCEIGSDVQSIKDMRVFISYAHEDYETALKIRNYLDDLGAHVPVGSQLRPRLWVP